MKYATKNYSFAVTGGSGFVGRAVVRTLVGLGADMRVLTRSADADALIRSLGATPIRGDLEIDGGCDGFVSNGDVLIHAAARVAPGGRPADFHETTVAGTERLLAASLRHRPAKIVYVSSAGVYPVMPAGHVYAAERTPAAPTRDNLYGCAKLEAENLVRARCDAAGVPWTILRLCTIYGPGAWLIERVLTRLARYGPIRTIGDGANHFATLYVDDAARAIALAAVCEKTANRVYDVASEERVTQGQFLAGASEALGLPPPRGRIRPITAHVAARLAEMIVPLVNGRQPAARGFVRMLTVDQQIDSSRFREDTGWAPAVPFTEGMRRFGEAVRAGRCEAPNPAHQERRRAESSELVGR